MNNTQYDNPPLGCYFDGASGQTCNDLRVIELAIAYGWQNKDAYFYEHLSKDDLSDNGRDDLTEIVGEAEEYLNSLETRPFVYWQWNEGDFGLYPDLEGAQENCEFVSSSNRCRNGKEYPDDDYTGEWIHVNDHGNCTLYVRENGKDTEIWSVV
jgi:hypothetical protein